MNVADRAQRLRDRVRGGREEAGGDRSPAMVGSVARIARYPVKSLQGEHLERATFGPQGLVGDRRLGLVEVATGKVLSAKSYPHLLHAEARTSVDGVEVRLPGHSWIVAPAPELDEAASAWLDMDVRVEAPPAEGDSLEFAMSMNVDDESIDRFDWRCPPGSFADLADVHILSTASVRAAAARYPAGRWDIDRFRPTVLVEAAGEDFVDDGWVGGTLRFGTVEVSVSLPTIRCPMTTRAQGDLPADTDILRTVNRHHGGNLGVYCAMQTPGEVAVGAPVTFLPS